MPVTGKTKRVPSRLSYMLVMQDGRMMPDCFKVAPFRICDGSIAIWRINSKGRVISGCKGTVIDGEFHEDED